MSASSAIDADEQRHERHQADVAIADVRHLMGEHRFQLSFVHQLDEPGRHRYEGLLRAATGSECVRRVVLHAPHSGVCSSPAAMETFSSRR